MRALACALALFCLPVAAHEVKIATRYQPSAVVSLSYADGQPFAFEAYELYLPGKDIPEQVGRTNAAGQVIFLPGQQTDWRLKAFSGDGHGVDQRLSVTAIPDDAALPANPAGQVPRPLLLLAGSGILFGLFGIFQLCIRKKQS